MATEHQPERRDLPWLVRTRRRVQQRTQTEVAGNLGISTGALSRYESGDLGVLGDPTLRKLCEVLAIAVPEWLAGPVSGEAPAEAGVSGQTARYYCPTPFCPLNPWFARPGWVHFRPQFVESVAGVEVACQFCGAAMLSACGNCGAALGQHAVCPACGEDYVPRVDQEVAREVMEWNAMAARGPLPTGDKVPFWQPLQRPPRAELSGRPGQG